MRITGSFDHGVPGDELPQGEDQSTDELLAD
jgi:hypothetical protein